MADQLVEMDYAMIQAVASGYTAQATMLTQIMGQIAIATNLCVGYWSMAAIPGMQGHQIALAMVPKLMEMRQNCALASGTCAQIASALTAAVGDHRKGDVAGKTYFTSGSTV